MKTLLCCLCLLTACAAHRQVDDKGRTKDARYKITLFNDDGYQRTWQHCRLCYDNEEGWLKFALPSGKTVQSHMFYVCEEE